MFTLTNKWFAAVVIACGAVLGMAHADDLLRIGVEYGDGAPSWQWNFAQAGALPGDGSVVDNSPSLGGLVLDASGNLTYAPNNLVLNSATLGTQGVMVGTQSSYILSFYGTDSVTMSGAYAGTVNGTGASNQVYLKFTPSSAGTLTLTVSGSVTRAVLAAVTYETSPRPQDQVATTGSAYYGPKFDYGQGLRIWEARTNLALNNNSLSGWSVYQALDTAAQTTSPDGTVDAASLTATVTTLGNYSTYQSATMTASQPYTVSGFFKPKNYNYAAVQIKDQTGTNTYSVNVNIATCTFDSTNVQGSPTGTAYTVTPAPNGFCRISATLTNVAVTGTGYGQFCLGNTASPTWGTGCPWLNAAIGSGVYVWGAGIEQGKAPSAVIPTGGATVTAAAENVDFAGSLAAISQTNMSVVAEGVVQDYDFSGQPTFIGNSGDCHLDGQPTPNRVATWTPIGGYLYANGAAAPNTVIRSGLGWNSIGRTVVQNGSTPASDAAVMGVHNPMNIGRCTDGYYLNGHIRSLAIYPTRLPAAVLQSKSVVGSPY